MSSDINLPPSAELEHTPLGCPTTASQIMMIHHRWYHRCQEGLASDESLYLHHHHVHACRMCVSSFDTGCRYQTSGQLIG